MPPQTGSVKMVGLDIVQDRGACEEKIGVRLPARRSLWSQVSHRHREPERTTNDQNIIACSARSARTD